MQTDEFLKLVRERAGLADNERAKRASEVVFQTLRIRISHEGGDNVAQQLPKDLKELWESGAFAHVQRALAGVERLDLGAFLARIAQQLGLDDISQAETVTRAVFMSLHEQLTTGAQQSISHQLPQDIRGFWEASVAGAQGPPYEWEAPVQDLEETEIDVTISETEAEVRQTKAEKKPTAHQPAMDRVTMASPPGGHHDVEGPGSAEHYRSDAELTEEIEEMLDESDEIDAENIDVFVQAGNVTLRGCVRSPHEREMALRTVSEALGVGEIRSELELDED
ncbi:MAG: DUF2267 domain-containing protein [Armatimonadota bacterium]